MKTLKISKAYTILQDFLESKELEEIFEGYADTELNRRIRVWYQATEFIAAYVVDVDPNLNFGQPFKLFHHYLADGIYMIKEVTAISALSNAPFKEVIVRNMEIRFTDNMINKTDSGREHLRESKRIVTS